MTLKPFFCYYGGKWRAAPKYPAPQYGLIIEPFAGAAGYSTRYSGRQVKLFDIDPIIVGLWQYLIKATPKEILDLPLILPGQTVDDFNICQEAKWLIGFWINKGSATPCRSPSSWMRSGTRPNSHWGVTVRRTLSQQVVKIKHWTCTLSSYAEVPNEEATWFIDPPYQKAGKYYRYKKLDYTALATWSMQRSGQCMVCEAKGADWLPFRSLGSFLSNPSKGNGKSEELIWP